MKKINKKGVSGLFAFLIIIPPIIITMVIITTSGEYWLKEIKIGDLNSRYLNTFLKYGYDGEDFTRVNAWLNQMSKDFNRIDCSVAFVGKVGDIEFETFKERKTIEEFKSIIQSERLGRNEFENRQDWIGIYIESNKPAYLSSVLKNSIGWFKTTTDEDLHYSDYIAGEVEKWIDSR